MRRQRDLQRLAAAGPLDLLVVGGGAHGAAVLRSACLHDLNAALCEQHDYAAATSSRSSRLIHGGLRYLEHGHVRLVAEALIERRVLLHIAPHLVAPLAIHIPVYSGGSRGAWKVRAGLWLYDRLARSARLDRSGLMDTAAVERDLSGLERHGLRAVGRLWDARVREPERLVIETLIDAERVGGTAVNRTAVMAVERADSEFLRVHLVDHLGNRELAVTARTVVNAAGPWVGTVDSRAAVERPTPLQWVRGSHLLFRQWEGGPTAAILGEATDHRPFFVLPWDRYIIVGTTEVAERQLPEAPQPTAAEIDYLQEAFSKLWPSAAGRQPYAAYAGVRALPTGTHEHAADRRHRLLRHDLAGYFTILGGKLTTHRLAGEEATRAVLEALGRTRPSNQLSAHRELPGAQCEAEALDINRLAARAGIDPSAARLLMRRWGCRAWAVAADFGANGPIDGLAGLRPEEIGFAWRHEGAASLEDVLLRRTDAVYDPELSRAGIDAAARAWCALPSMNGTATAETVAAAVIERLEQEFGRRF